MYTHANDDWQADFGWGNPEIYDYKMNKQILKSDKRNEIEKHGKTGNNRNNKQQQQNELPCVLHIEEYNNNNKLEFV